ncbi:MAG: hypothetical protein IT328_18575 [Caldilineaceae bacterium]|nr:hypothetical protein [Caldilineaceae bacterium]
MNVYLDRIQRRMVIAGIVGLILVVVGVLLDLDQFYQSYLYAYLFWLGITLGSLAWLLIHDITGGEWGVAVRPLLETSALLIGLMALLFIPLFFGIDRLYVWARPEVVAQDALLQHKEPYLNIPFFAGRAVFYFIAWGGSIFLLNRWWRRQAQQPTLGVAARLRRFSAPALALYGLTMTFGSFDWLMSLDPHWYSTIFGVLVAAGQATAGLAFAIGVAVYLGHFSPFSELVTADHLNDLGNLLLTAVIFWAYIAFMQYLIIWSGDLPEEVVWYLYRLEGGWNWVPLALLFFHFIVPFVMLLSSRVKRSAPRLASVALLLLVAELVHLYWLVAPAFSHSQFTIHWLDFVMPVFIGGLWLAAFIWQLRRQVLVLSSETTG